MYNWFSHKEKVLSKVFEDNWTYHPKTVSISGSPWNLNVQRKKKRFFNIIMLGEVIFYLIIFNSDKREEELHQATDLLFSEWVLSINRFRDEENSLEVC
jgi:hypothetical protein